MWQREVRVTIELAIDGCLVNCVVWAVAVGSWSSQAVVAYTVIVFVFFFSGLISMRLLKMSTAIVRCFDARWHSTPNAGRRLP